MGGIVDAVFGDGESKSSTTVVNSTAPMSEEEKQLISLNTQLAQKQLENINTLQPLQQQLVQQSLESVNQGKAYTDALNKLISPDQQAQAVADEFARSKSQGAAQDEILKLQLDTLRQGGRATPEQLQQIKDATDAGIAAGTGDIDIQTKRGIGLIADELANARGLRLSDSPIGSEAALLTRAGEDQKGSLIKTLRANQASAALNYPLAAAGVTSGINQNQQSILQNAQQFQTNLRQQAFQNRLALTGQTSSAGIGLSGIGNGGAPGLAALSANNLANGTQSGNGSSYDPGKALSGLGSLAQGAGMAYLAFSDPDLKDDLGTIGKTADGIGLHLYRYKGDDKVRIGVMADEVEKIKPSAVKRHKSGYRMVDYAGIGLTAVTA